MSGIEEKVWSELGEVTLETGNLAARQAVPHLTSGLLAAIGYNRRRHFLISLSPEDGEYKDTASRGLNIETRELDINNLPRGRYLDLECSDPSGHEAFDLIGNNIAQLLHDTELSSVEAVTEVLARWRRFWGQLPRTTLSEEALLGLFGEVWHLANWLIPLLGVNAVEAWKGPTGARHDFQFTSTSIEVKTTTSTRGRIHSIHGIDQLSPQDNGQLYLFSLRLRKEPGATNNLPGIIEGCNRQLADHTSMLDLFEQNLIQAGYSPLHAEHYREIQFRIVEEALFEVRDDFPRITRADFLHELPGGVEGIEYIINLSTFDHLCVGKIPEDIRSLTW